MLEQKRRQSRKSLRHFIESLGTVPARHHCHIIEKLEAVERGEIQRLMLFLPPGSAKSTYASVLFPAWFLGRNPEKGVLAASHTTELAEKFGRRVRNIIAGEEFGEVFKPRLAPDSQAAGRWALREGGEYYAAGVGSAILGYRADLGLIDDPIAGREQADSEREREKVWDWYKSDFYTRLKPGAAIVLIMQRWREDDLAGMLLADEKNGGEHWEVVKLPMVAGADDPLGRAEGELLWPEWYRPEMIEQAKRDPRNWLALYQQEPRPESGGEFKKEWIQRYKTKPESGTNNYIIVDPAGEKKKTSDYTGIWVLGLGADQNIYALDIVRDRLNLAERTRILFELHRKYRPLKVGYEKYGMQSDIEHIKDVQERVNYRFAITELGGSLKKEDRIRRLIPYFEAGRVWLPESLHRTDSTGSTRELVEEFIEEEYLPFPVGRHDDLMDPLSRIDDPLLMAEFPKEKKRTASTYTQPRGEHAWAAMVMLSTIGAIAESLL